MANETIPYWQPGDTPTCHAKAAVTGKRFVAISGPRVGGNPQVSPAGAGVKVFGVAGRDAAAGTKVIAHTEGIVPVTAGAALTAGQEVQSDATGQAIVLAAGKPAGSVVDDVALGADAPIQLA